MKVHKAYAKKLSLTLVITILFSFYVVPVKAVVYTVNTSTLNSYTGIHPRLFVDNTTVEALRQVKSTTHANMWAKTQSSADSILGTAIPVYPSPEPDPAQLWQRDVGNNMTSLAFAYLMTKSSNPVPTQTIWLEAEEYRSISAPMQVYSEDPNNTSGRLAIATPENGLANMPTNTLPTPSATYTFEVAETNNYTVWARVKAENGAGDSFYAWIDNGDMNMQYNPTTFGSWVWKSTIYKQRLTPGTHTLNIAYREDGLKIDKFAITSNTSLNPSGLGTEEHRFEAEDGVLTTPMAVYSDEYLAFGKKYIKVPSGTLPNPNPVPAVSATPHAKYTFTVQGGYYDIWIREKAVGGGSDSYYCSVDGGSIAGPAVTQSKYFIWSKAVNNKSLAAGTHNFAMWYREPEFKVDQIFIVPHSASDSPPGPNNYLMGALEWALAACDYPTWGVGSNYDGVDLGAAQLLTGLATVYDWCYNDISSENLTTIRNKLIAKGEQMKAGADFKGWKNQWLQNHMWISMTGLTAAGCAIFDEYPGCTSWFDKALEKMSNTMTYLGTDGASHEGIGYWEYGAEWLLRFMDVSRKLLGADMYSTTWFQKTADYRLKFSIPLNSWSSNGSSVDFADHDRKEWCGSDYIMRKLAHEYGNGQSQWLANQIDAKDIDNATSTWLNMLWYDPNIIAVSPSDASTATLSRFDDMEFVVSRSSWDGNESMLAYKCGPYLGHTVYSQNTTNPYVDWGGGHVHPDDNHFVLFGCGEWLLKDDGYSYKYTSQHNTLLVNNVGQLGEGGQWFNASAAKNANPSIQKAVSVNSKLDHIVGDAASAYPSTTGLTKFKRHLLYLKDDNALIVVDDIALSASQPLTLRFFPESQTTPVAQGDGSYISTGTNAKLRFAPLTSGVSISVGNVNVYDRNNTASAKKAYQISTTGSSWKNATALTWSASPANPATVQYTVNGNVMTFVVNDKTVTLDLSTDTANEVE